MKILGVTHASNFHADESFATALIKFWCQTLDYEFDFIRVLHISEIADYPLEGYDRIFVYDIGGMYDLYDSSNDFGVEVFWMDHHQDNKLPCAAVLVNRTLQLLLEAITPTDSTRLLMRFLIYIEPQLSILSDWDTRGVRLRPDSVFDIIRAFRTSEIVSNQKMNLLFDQSVNYFGTIIIAWHQMFCLDEELRRNTDDLLTEVLPNTKYHFAVNFTDRFDNWREANISLYITNDRRNPDNYIIIRHDDLADKLHFQKMDQFTELGDFRHANGFMMSFRKENYEKVLDVCSNILKHY